MIEDIKNGVFLPVYALYGEERYLIRQYKNDLVRAMTDPEDSMNYAVFSGAKADRDEIISLADTMPFFAPRRVIVWEDCPFLKKADDVFCEYLNQMPPTTHLILTGDTADKRIRTVKMIAKTGRMVECARQNEQTLTLWVLGRIKKENKKITKKTLERFLSAAGNDMDRISNELEKLLSYTEGTDAITDADVDAVCAPLIEDRAFQMIDAVAAGERSKVLSCYNDLLLLKESPLRILSLLSRQFHQLLVAKQMKSAGKHVREIAGVLKIPVFAAGKCVTASDAFKLLQIQEALAACADTEEEIKSGRIKDQIGVELLLITLSKKDKKTG